MTSWRMVTPSVALETEHAVASMEPVRLTLPALHLTPRANCACHSASSSETFTLAVVRATCVTSPGNARAAHIRAALMVSSVFWRIPNDRVKIRYTAAITAHRTMDVQARF